jgi:hypothetical protein
MQCCTACKEGLAMSIHLDDPVLTIQWDEEGRFVCSVSKAAAKAEQLLPKLDVGIRLLAEKKAHRWLGDTRYLDAPDPIEVKRVNEEWLPRAVAAGLRRMAVVAPKRVVITLVIRSFMTRIDGREVANEYFDDLDAARAWLCAG